MASEDLLKPVLVVTNVLGLTSVQFDRTSGRYRQSRNRSVTILVNVFFITLLNLLYQWFVLATIKRRFKLYGVVFGLLIILDSELSFVRLYVTILNNCLKSKYILKSCNTLLSIWMKTKSQPWDDSKYRGALVFMYAMIVLNVLYYFVFMISLQQLVSKWSRDWVRTGIDLMFGMLSTVNDSYVIMFNTLLLLLRAELIGINQRMLQSTSAINNVHVQANLYFEITSLIHLLGNAFMIPIMFNIFAIFLSGTIQLFQLFEGMIDGSREHWELAYLLKELTTYGVWLWLRITTLFITMWQADRISQEANETALCTRHFDDYTMNDAKVTKQLNKFLLKNLHQKKKFSAYGFFDIDNSVIYTVFSAIITYLVILLQFKQLENDLTMTDGSGNNTTNTQ